MIDICNTDSHLFVFVACCPCCDCWMPSLVCSLAPARWSWSCELDFEYFALNTVLDPCNGPELSGSEPDVLGSLGEISVPCGLSVFLGETFICFALCSHRSLQYVLYSRLLLESIELLNIVTRMSCSKPWNKHARHMGRVHVARFGSGKNSWMRRPLCGNHHWRISFFDNSTGHGWWCSFALKLKLMLDSSAYLILTFLL